MDEHSCIVVMMLGDDRVKSQLLRLQLKVEPEQMPGLVNLLNTNFTGISVDEMNLRLMDLSEQVTPQLFFAAQPDRGLRRGCAGGGRTAGDRHRRGERAFEAPRVPGRRQGPSADELFGRQQGELPMPEEGPMKILIGPENVSEALQNTSVVVASYDIGGDMRGLIGVVGPTRMDYASVAARLAGFADGLTRMFGKQEGLPPKEDTKT